MRRKGRILLLLALLVLLAGCAKAAPDPTPTPVPLVGLPGGAEVPIDAESLDLSGIPAVETEAALAQLEQFPDLRELKLGGEGLFTLEQVERLQTEHPEWRLEYMLRIAGRDTGIEAESLDLSSLTADEVEQVLPRLRLMPRLRLVELGGERAEGPDWEQIRELEEAAANADFSYRFSIADRNFNLRDSELDLNHIPMTDEGALVRRIIACMPNLNPGRLSLGRGGLADLVRRHLFGAHECGAHPRLQDELGRGDARPGCAGAEILHEGQIPRPRA